MWRVTSSSSHPPTRLNEILYTSQSSTIISLIWNSSFCVFLSHLPELQTREHISMLFSDSQHLILPPPHEREREWKRKRNSKVSCLSPLGMLRVEAIVILPGYPLGATGLKVPRGPDDGRLSLPIVQLKSFASAEPFFLQRVCNSKEVIKPFQLRRLFPDLRFQLI